MRPGLLAVSSLLVACGSPPLEGARAVPPREQPPGRILAEFAPHSCVASDGRPVSRPFSRLVLLEAQTRQLLLLETRPLHDTLVIENAFVSSDALTFQAISDPRGGRRTLSEYRFDWPALSHGTLSAALSFRLLSRDDRGFQASPNSVSLRCKLGRTGPPGELDTASAVR